MPARYLVAGLCVILVLSMTTGVSAQGVQTGKLAGTVKDNQGLVIPGATVTIGSPAMQGLRTTLTDGSGVFQFRGLLPGVYTATFTLQGMTDVEQTTPVRLGGSTAMHATMQLAALEQRVDVVAPAPSVVAAAQASSNLAFTELDTLALDRTPSAIADLAPGLTTNTPNSRQIAVSGAFAYDNVGSSHKCMHDLARSRSSTPGEEAADVLVAGIQRGSRLSLSRRPPARPRSWWGAYSAAASSTARC